MKYKNSIFKNVNIKILHNLPLKKGNSSIQCRVDLLENALKEESMCKPVHLLKNSTYL